MRQQQLHQTQPLFTAAAQRTSQNSGSPAPEKIVSKFDCYDACFLAISSIFAACPTKDCSFTELQKINAGYYFLKAFEKN